MTADQVGSFPWLLALQYLLAGVGAVIGVLSAALASNMLRIQDSDDFSTGGTGLSGCNGNGNGEETNAHAHTTAVTTNGNSILIKSQDTNDNNVTAV